MADGGDTKINVLFNRLLWDNMKNYPIAEKKVNKLIKNITQISPYKGDEEIITPFIPFLDPELMKMFKHLHRFKTNNSINGVIAFADLFGERVVLKASVGDDLEQEFLVSEVLNRIRYAIPNFAYTLALFNAHNRIKDTDDGGSHWKRVGSKDTDEIQSVLVSERVSPGISLYDYINNESTSPGDFLALFLQLLLALDAAQKSIEFTHYDLHCGNVLLRSLPEGIDDVIVHYCWETEEAIIPMKYVGTFIDFARSHVNKFMLLEESIKHNIPIDIHQAFIMEGSGMDSNVFKPHFDIVLLFLSCYTKMNDNIRKIFENVAGEICATYDVTEKEPYALFSSKPGPFENPRNFFKYLHKKFANLLPKVPKNTKHVYWNCTKARSFTETSDPGTFALPNILNRTSFPILPIVEEWIREDDKLFIGEIIPLSQKIWILPVNFLCAAAFKSKADRSLILENIYKAIYTVNFYRKNTKISISQDLQTLLFAAFYFNTDGTLLSKKVCIDKSFSVERSFDKAVKMVKNYGLKYPHDPFSYAKLIYPIGDTARGTVNAMIMLCLLCERTSMISPYNMAFFGLYLSGYIGIPGDDQRAPMRRDVMISDAANEYPVIDALMFDFFP